MRTAGVVEAEIRAQVGLRGRHRVVGLEIHLLILDALPEPLDEDVVPPRALAIHADLNAVVVEQLSEVAAGKLTALIGVEDFRGAMPCNRVPYCVQTEVRCQRVGDAPGQHPA